MMIRTLKDRVRAATGVADPALRAKKAADVRKLSHRKRKRDDLIQRIKDALDTEEDGDALVEVASNARRAEQELAELMLKQDEHYV